MAKLLLALVLVFQLVFPAVAYAADPVPVVDVTQPLLLPLKVGDKAPWPGVLLNAPAVAQIKVNLDSAKAECDIEVRKAQDIVKAQATFELANEKASHEKDKAVDAAVIKEKTLTVADLQKRLDESEKSRPNVYLWTGVGVVGGVVLTVLTVFAVSQASK